MAQNKIKEKLIKEIKDEMGGTTKELRSIIESQFEYVAYRMGKGEFEGIRLPYFGLFHCNPNRVKNLNHETFQRRKFPNSNRD
jgi:nucleoid DNA-binding protein